jgi:type III pantothenate kinase
VILAIDIGNTRLKWGVCDAPNSGFRAVGRLALEELDKLRDDWRSLPALSRIGVASVADSAVNERVAAALAPIGIAPQWLASQPRACGVTNGYERPAELGVDRFAALVAVRARQAGDCLIVLAGTATTADMLSADGGFLGGAILPGLDLMKRSLANHTARLPFAQGAYRETPRNTADAIESGCLNAQAGAIERMRARLGPEAACWISGGAAAAIITVLAFPATFVEHLVLEGIARLVS